SLHSRRGEGDRPHAAGSTAPRAPRARGARLITARTFRSRWCGCRGCCSRRRGGRSVPASCRTRRGSHRHAELCAAVPSTAAASSLSRAACTQRLNTVVTPPVSAHWVVLLVGPPPPFDAVVE